MEPKVKEMINNNIITSLKNIKEYNSLNFVEDSLQLKNILTSELRNRTDLKTCLNNLRALLRDNKPLFCSLFTNLIKPYLSVLKSENILTEEYIYVLVDILHNKSQIEKYYKKWIKDIIGDLLIFYGQFRESKINEQITSICGYIEYLFDEFITIDEKGINLFVSFFDSMDLIQQKMAGNFFFKYINRYDVNKINIIDWKNFFNICTDALEDKYNEEETKKVIHDIFNQIYKYFQQLKLNPNDALISAGNLEAAKYFQTITGFNTEDAKSKLRLMDF